MMANKVTTYCICVLSVIALPVVLFLIFTLLAPGFGTSSIFIVLRQALIPTVTGIAMAFGQTAGIFDLSVGTRVILAATCGGVLGNLWGIPGIIIGSLLGGILPAILMGGLHNLLRLPSLVLSLGIVLIFEIVTSSIMGHNGQVTVPGSIAILGKSPWCFIITIACAIVFFFLYYHTKFSYHVRVVGNNELLAKNMGISVRRVNFLCFAVGGIFVGIVGILQICYSNSVSASISMASMSLVFKPMMGVMIAMELLKICDNFALNIVVGEVCISIIFNGLIALGLPATMQDVVLGLFMLLVMAVSANRGASGTGKLLRRDLKRAKV